MSGCHAANGGEFPLTTYEAVMQHVTAGDAGTANSINPSPAGAPIAYPGWSRSLVGRGDHDHLCMNSTRREKQLTSPPMKKTILAALLIVSGLTACYYDNFEEIHPTIPGGTTCVIPDTVSYATNIQPIADASCGTDDNGCHDAANSINLGGNGSLADYAGTVETIADDGITTFMGRIRQTVAQKAKVDAERRR